MFEIAGISFYTSINLRGNILWRMSVVSLMYSCTGRQRNNLFGKRLYIHKAKTNTISKRSFAIVTGFKNFIQNKMHPLAN